MLPTNELFGVRLAAILPTALARLVPSAAETPTTRCAVVIVVDGLGWHNLQARSGHARNLSRFDGSPISTVFPTTTGAALSTLTTGALPGTHGLVGYRIRHPELGLRTTLSDWHGISPVRSWQTQETVFEQAQRLGVASHVIGRAAHRTGGLTEAILTGATYHSGDTIEERCERALQLTREAVDPSIVYVYVDELDRAGHRFGWQSHEWIERLEQLDGAVASLVSRLSDDVGVVLTADHGMVDVPVENHVHLDAIRGFMDGIATVGGEPRLRYLYLDEPGEASVVAERTRVFLDDRAAVLTRDEVVNAGMFGPLGPDIADRIGDVVVAATGLHAFFVQSEPSTNQSMIGHHGSVSDTERHVPVITAGTFADAQFIEALDDYGQRRS